MKNLEFIVKLKDLSIEFMGMAKKITELSAKGYMINSQPEVYFFDTYLPFTLSSVLKRDDRNRNKIKVGIRVNENYFNIDLDELIPVRIKDFKTLLVNLKSLTKERKVNILINKPDFDRIKVVDSFGSLGNLRFFVYSLPNFYDVCFENLNNISLIDEVKDLFNMKNLLKKSFDIGKFTKFNEQFTKINLYVPEMCNDFAKESEKRLHNHLMDNLKKSYRDGFSNEKVTLRKKVYRIKKPFEAIVLTDLHGDLKSFLDVLFLENVYYKLLYKDDFAIIFLGDYIDRGTIQLNVLRAVFLLQYMFPEKVFTLRGNHEDIKFDEEKGIFLSAENTYENDTYVGSWGDKFGIEYLKKLSQYFNEMPLFLVYEPLKIFMVHGGLPPFKDEGEDIFDYFDSLEDLSEPFEKNGIKYDPTMVLWSRIRDNDNVKFFEGRKSYEFAKKQVDQFFKKMDVNMIIRGHDPEALKTYFDGKVITFHTTGGGGNPCSPYYSFSISMPTYLKISKRGNIVAKRIVSPNYEDFPDKSVFAIVEELKGGDIE